MASLNLCQFIGNAGADPEIRTFNDGRKVANVRIAVTEKYTGKDGQTHESTEWIPVVFNGKLADVVANYVKKGSPVYVSGKWSTRSWEDQDGKTRYSAELKVSTLQLLGPKPQVQQQAAPAPGYAPQGYPQQPVYQQPQGYPQNPGYQQQPAYPPQQGLFPPQPGQQGHPQYPPMNDPSYSTPQSDDLPEGF